MYSPIGRHIESIEKVFEYLCIQSLTKSASPRSRRQIIYARTFLTFKADIVRIRHPKYNTITLVPRKAGNEQRARSIYSARSSAVMASSVPLKTQFLD